MNTKNLRVIINHLKSKEEIEKVIEKFNYNPELCIIGLKYYKEEESKIILAKKTNFDEDVCVEVMNYLTADIRRIYLLEKSNFNRIVCDAAMKSFNFVEKKNKYMIEILEKVSYNEIFKESLATYLSQQKE